MRRIWTQRYRDAFYAYSCAKLPAITVDLGTATTIGVITEDEGFIGGAIGKNTAD